MVFSTDNAILIRNLRLALIMAWILVTYGLVSNEGYFKDKYFYENSQEADVQSA